MIILFLILIVIASVILGFIVLVQNPKGGGLAGSIGGIGNQFMGVKQTTDVLEKGTWFFAVLIGILCITSVAFLKPTGSSPLDDIAPVKTTVPAQQSPAPAK
jgi:preprotein translocase subunit SecG